MKLIRPIKLALRRPPKQRPRMGKSALHSRASAATMDEAYDEEDGYDAEEEPNMKLSHAFIVVLILHLIAVGGVFAFNSIKARQNAEAKSAVAKSGPVKTAPSEPAAAPHEAARTEPVAPDGWKGKVHTVVAGDTLTRIASVHGTTVEAIEKENGVTSLSMIRVGQVLKIPAVEAAVAKTAQAAPARPAAAEAGAAKAKEAFLATKKPASTEVPVAKAVAAKPADAPPAKPAASESSTPEVYVVAKGDNPYSIAKKFHVSYNALIAANEIKDATKIQIGQKLKIPAKKN